MMLRRRSVNSHELIVGSVVILFSYGTPVACRTVGEGCFARHTGSQTTSSHISAFLNGAPFTEVSADFFDAILSDHLKAALLTLT